MIVKSCISCKYRGCYSYWNGNEYVSDGKYACKKYPISNTEKRYLDDYFPEWRDIAMNTVPQKIPDWCTKYKYDKNEKFI